MLNPILTVASKELIDGWRDRRAVEEGTPAELVRAGGGRMLNPILTVASTDRAVAEGTPAELRERAGAATLEDAFVAFTGAQEVAAC